MNNLKKRIKEIANSVSWVKVQKKGRDLTQPYDRSPYTDRIKADRIKAENKIKAEKNFDLRLEMVDPAHCPFERIKSWQ